MPSVLFVCTANICRSPAAEVLFSDWLARQGVPGDWEVSSAGTWAAPGQAAAVFSREVTAERGLDLAQHRSRRVDEDMLRRADVTVCMTRSQCESLQIEFPSSAGKIHLLTALTGQGYDVSDPFGGPREGYEVMVRELGQLIETAGPRIVALAGEPAGD